MNTAFALVRTLFITLTLAGWSASALAAAPQPEIPDAWPQWLQDDMSKEAKKKRKSSVEVAGMTLRYRGKQQEDPIDVDTGRRLHRICRVVDGCGAR
ncbi:MAG: hypothetical protein AB8G16_16105 [Gammaproteobacteria bacterium]